MPSCQQQLPEGMVQIQSRSLEFVSFVNHDLEHQPTNIEDFVANEEARGVVVLLEVVDDLTVRF